MARTSIERKMYGSNVQPTDNPINQASHAAAPEQHNAEIQGGHVILVIATLMVGIYGLKVLGRCMKNGK